MRFQLTLLWLWMVLHIICGENSFVRRLKRIPEHLPKTNLSKVIQDQNIEHEDDPKFIDLRKMRLPFRYRYGNFVPLTNKKDKKLENLQSFIVVCVLHGILFLASEFILSLIWSKFLDSIISLPDTSKVLLVYALKSFVSGVISMIVYMYTFELNKIMVSNNGFSWRILDSESMR